MIKRVLFINVLVFFLLSPLSEGADWLHFIQNERGENRYIDVDTITQTSPHTLEVVQKVEPLNSPDISYILSRLEIDCSGRRIKVMEETIHEAKGEVRTIRVNGDSKEVRPDDLEESLLELLCSLKKSGR